MVASSALKKTPSRSLQKEPFHSEKLFLSMPSKWHHSALKNSSYRCIQNDTLPTSFRSQKLPAPIPLNNPSHALKTPSLDPFKQPLSSSQNSPSRSLQTTTSHTVKLSLPHPKRKSHLFVKLLKFFFLPKENQPTIA